jgi:hypothetical protein
MVTTRMYRDLLFLALAVSLGCGTLTVARAQTPNGEFLCSAGPRDGQACNGDPDCAPGGVCVIGQGVCNGGTADGSYCDCAAGTCTATTPACDPTLTGVCVGGPSDTFCCDVTTNCSDGAACVGAQKVCLGGDGKGVSCLNDGQCPGSLCRSTGKFCSGGDFDSFSCVDNNDCKNVDGTSVGVCTAAAVPPTPTNTISTPIATRTPTPTRPAGTGVPTATWTPTPPGGTVPPSETPTPIPNATPTTVVHVVEIDSPYKAIGQGGGCSLVGTREPLGSGWLSAAGLAFTVLRRRRKR